MKKRLMLVLSMTLLSALAAEETWRVGSTTYLLTRVESGALINSICVQNPQCQALQLSQHKTPQRVLAGGKNPASLACKEKGGVVFIAQKGKATQAFCRFKDHSFISLSGFFQ